MSGDFKPLVLRDEIHGDIRLDEVARAVVDHPGFQRLRYIRQLGLAEYVFPSATHTRFQHSLGAAFLAREYFESVLDTWSQWGFDLDGKIGQTHFRAAQTRECLMEVAQHAPSRLFWSRVATLAGMLHDVGHGPWSHTFEYLDLPQDFSSETAQLGGALKAFFDDAQTQRRRIWHEDVSVLYVARILSDLARAGTVPEAQTFILPISVLVNKRLLEGKGRDQVRSQLESELQAAGIRGGFSTLRLLSPLISGPFDVDRADYIQRDGRNCGVSMGGIEWGRIVRKVMPCLADHPNSAGEPTDIVLVTHMKNQHVLDDFIFSLFQMYTQVFLHPKIVAFEDQIRRELAAKVPVPKPTIDFAAHQSLSDEGFRAWLERAFQADGVRKILFREAGYRFQVVGLPTGHGERAGLGEAGYHCVETQDRPMLKDSMGVYLFSSPGEGGAKKPELPIVLSWKEASPIANHFHSINHTSEIWIRPEVPPSA